MSEAGIIGVFAVAIGVICVAILQWAKIEELPHWPIKTRALMGIVCFLAGAMGAAALLEVIP